MEPSRTHPSGGLYERLVARGWRMTAQRRAVSQALDGDHVHLTADEVFRAAQEALPELSLATVYNTLNDLVAMGEVREVATGRGPMRYDPNGEPHHHLMCVDCGEILDVQVEDAPQPEELHDYELIGTDVLFRGRCQSCASS